MKTVDCLQGDALWLQSRRGRVTASRVADALALLKRGDKQGGDTAGRANLKAEIVAEILTGSASEHYVSPYMERGTAMEPFARAAYEAKYDVMVDQIGLVIHPTIDRAGASPDGLVGKDGLVEIKCPKTETHLRYMLAAVLPPEYEPQVMWQLACTDRQWCDFVSFDDRLPVRHQIFRVRVMRDETRIAEMEAGVEKFLAEVDEIIAKLNDLNPEVEQPAPEPMTLAEQLSASLLDEDIAAWYRTHGMEAK